MLAARDVRREPQRQRCARSFFPPRRFTTSVSMSHAGPLRIRSVSQRESSASAARQRPNASKSSRMFGQHTENTPVRNRYRVLSRIHAMASDGTIQHRRLTEITRSSFHKRIVRGARDKNTYAELAVDKLGTRKEGSAVRFSSLAASFDARFFAG